MPATAQDNAVLAKTRELCASILEEPEYREHLDKVENFIANEEARAQFEQLSEKGDALHRKQHEGTTASPEEISEFESLRSSAMDDETISGFIAAREQLHGLHSTISGYVAKTLELGRVPEPGDFEEESSGCCNSGGCGCEH
ncbi:MAG: YlbF family regulator [Verrucomicrobiales bacterium]